MSSDNTAQDTLVYITIPSDVENKRVDSYLAGCEELELTRNRIQQLIEKGLITLDGETISKKYIVRGGESLAVTIPLPLPRASRPRISRSTLSMRMTICWW